MSRGRGGAAGEPARGGQWGMSRTMRPDRSHPIRPPPHRAAVRAAGALSGRVVAFSGGMIIRLAGPLEGLSVVAPSYRGLPLPSGGRLPLRVAVPPLPPGPARHRGAAARARRRGRPRDGPAVGAPVRPGLCRGCAPAPSGARWPGAPGRGVRHDQRRAAVPVAGRGPARDRARHPAAKPAGRGRGPAFPPEADDEDPAGAPGARHRQAPLLRRRPPRGDAVGRTPLPQGLNHRAENSHRPTRQRERAMRGFRPVGCRLTRPRSAASQPRCRPRRHLTAPTCRAGMVIRFANWDRITGVAGLPAVA